jgi:hypothetical protein
VALVLGSATLVARTTSLPDMTGAVYRPVEEIVPPAPPLSTDQLTLTFDAFCTVAPNCWVCDGANVTFCGATATVTGGMEGEGGAGAEGGTPDGGTAELVGVLLEPPPQRINRTAIATTIRRPTIPRVR